MLCGPAWMWAHLPHLLGACCASFTYSRQGTSQKSSEPTRRCGQHWALGGPALPYHPLPGLREDSTCLCLSDDLLPNAHLWFSIDITDGGWGLRGETS